MARGRGPHSTRTPGDGPSEAEEGKGENETDENEQPDDLGAFPRPIARVPGGIMLGGIGVVAGIHSNILRGRYSMSPFCGL